MPELSVNSQLLFTAIVFWLFALHPFITYPASLFAAKSVYSFFRKATAERGSAPTSVAICFTAYNEAAALPSKIANLQELCARGGSGRVQAYAYTDGCTDRSEALLRDSGACIEVIAGTENRGKSHGLNMLVARAQENIVVFTDANVIFADDAITRLLNYFSDPSVGCVCGRLEYVNQDAGATAHVGGLYWRLEESVKQLESDTGNVMGADGSIFAIRRELFEPIPVSALPDMFVSFAVLFKGFRIVSAPDVVAYERSATDRTEEFARKIRIACRAFNYHRAHWPELRTMSAWDLYKYLSHKLLRWLSFLWLTVALMLTLVAAFKLPVALALGAVLAAAAIVAYRFEIPLLGKAATILAAMLATALGVAQSLRGRSYVAWRPAGTAR